MNVKNAGTQPFRMTLQVLAFLCARKTPASVNDTLPIYSDIHADLKI